MDVLVVGRTSTETHRGMHSCMLCAPIQESLSIECKQYEVDRLAQTILLD